MGDWPSVDNVLLRYDCHIYFDASDPKDVESALALREELIRTFPDVRVFKMWYEPIGPHTRAMFEAEVDTAEKFARVVPWLCLNHKHHSVLIHPYHKDESLGGYDHSKYPLWLGEQLPLDLRMFTDKGVPI